MSLGQRWPPQEDRLVVKSGDSGCLGWTLALLLLSRFSRVRLCVTPLTAAHQAPLSLGFSRQEHWSGLPFPSPMHESERWKWSRSVVSDSLQPHGLQPTRLLHPCDFPGKSTGVGCHCLLLENALVVANTVYQQHKRRFHTWTSPNGQYWHQIDYILCSRRRRSCIQWAKTRPGANCGSDHQLLIAKFRLKLKKVRKTTRPVRYDLNPLWIYSGSDK